MSVIDINHERKIIIQMDVDEDFVWVLDNRKTEATGHPIHETVSMKIFIIIPKSYWEKKPVVAWLKYCRYGVKYQTINQLITM